MALADSGLVTGLAASTAFWANGTILSTSALDIITGFSAGAAVVLTDITGLSSTIVRNGGSTGLAGAGTIAHITGNYDSTLNTFTTSVSGTATLFVYDDDGSGGNANYRAIVLVGYVDAAQNDTGGTATGILGVA